MREEPLIASLLEYFDKIALNTEQVDEITNYLKEIHSSESVFHRESMQSLRKEQDKLQQRIGKMYDDKLDGLINEKLYLEKVKDTKLGRLSL